METRADLLAENIGKVEGRIAEACARAGRDRSEITLIAVSKTVDAASVILAHELGIMDFGENYVQSAREKVEKLRESGLGNLSFHMIGHLQRNKAKDAVDIFDSLHSLDSLRLVGELDKRLEEKPERFPCFVEVNVSGEESKYGVSTELAVEIVEASLRSKKIRPVGLMTMAPFFDKPEKSRPVFEKLRNLAGDINEKLGVDALKSLSMGMTNDFEVAVEEGATHLRIGRAIFETD